MKIVTLALVLTAGVGWTLASPIEPHEASATERFLNRPAEPLTQYRAIRRMEATNHRFKKHGWLNVHTELSPAHGFTVRVLDEGGASYIRNKVLRQILDGEREIVARGDAAHAALTTANYEIVREEPAELGLVRLVVKPRRTDMTLVDGAVLVTDTDADLVRVEGRLARNPSFWTKRVDIVRHYGRVAGVRVPLRIDSVAHVRIAGRSEMTMTYEYEMVNGHVLESPDADVARSPETRDLGWTGDSVAEAQSQRSVDNEVDESRGVRFEEL